MAEITDPALLSQLTASGPAGAGAGAQPIMDRTARLQLQSTGLPVLSQQMDPFARFTDPKQREMARSRMMASGEKNVAEGSASTTTARENIAKLAEFKDINSRGVSGGVGGWLASKMPTWLQTADQQRMDQLSIGMARGNRIPGEGTISDFDAAQFMKMTGGLDKGEETNAKFADATTRVQRARIDQQQFREAFLQANGSLVGADRLWTQYASANGLFDKGGALKQGRPSWSEYYAGRAGDALAEPSRRAGMLPPTGAGNPSTNAQAAPPQRAATQKPAGAVRVADDAGYNRLPRGARYVGPDGILRNK